MRRQVLIIGVLLAAFALFALGVQGSDAYDGNTGRFKTVEILVTQYVWELVSNADGRVICQVIVEHPNRPTNDEAIQICADQIFPAEPTPTPFVERTPTFIPTAGPSPTAPAVKEPTPTPAGTAAPENPGAAHEPDEDPFDLAKFFSSVSWRLVATNSFQREIKIAMPEIVVNLTIPPGQQQVPFTVILTAYEPVFSHRITGISGILDGWEFHCAGPRCDVPITTDSILEFWATSTLGDESRHTEAAFRVARTETGMALELVSLAPVNLFQDSCGVIWGSPDVNRPDWAKLPASPDELNTLKPYQYLAGQLISAGVVDASDCPGRGLRSDGAPNTCGIERAAPQVIEWQNQYDVAIWETGRTMGIPPRLIKALIEQESQFWPGNSRRALYEYGLGQLSQAGADVVLRWDNDLFASTCTGLIYDCSQVYGRLPSWIQATLRGGLMRNINAQCPTCPNGVDMVRAYDSIPVFTRTLRANCRQVKFVMDKRGMKAEYEDWWKFTFLSYHSGYNCLADALDYTRYNQQPADWAHVTAFLSCGSGRTYVDTIWKSLGEFETYQRKAPLSSQPPVVPTFAATPAPTRTPTPILAMSHIRVTVYVDANNNQYPDPGERADGVTVTATFPDGEVLTANSRAGDAVFDLSGRAIGADVVVSLPELFRTQKVRITRDGEIPVVFRLEQPVVPPALP